MKKVSKRLAKSHSLLAHKSMPITLRLDPNEILDRAIEIRNSSGHFDWVGVGVVALAEMDRLVRILQLTQVVSQGLTKEKEIAACIEQSQMALNDSRRKLLEAFMHSGSLEDTAPAGAS